MENYIVELLKAKVRTLTFYSMKYKDKDTYAELEKAKKALTYFKNLINR